MWSRLTTLFTPRPLSRARRDALHEEANRMACARGDHNVFKDFVSLGDFTELWHCCTRCPYREYMGEHRPGMSHHG